MDHPHVTMFGRIENEKGNNVNIKLILDPDLAKIIVTGPESKGTFDLTMKEFRALYEIMANAVDSFDNLESFRG